MEIIAAAIARPARCNAINRAMAHHGSDRHAAPACSKAVYVVSARIDGRRQRHGNVMASVRIVDRFQDTAGVQELRRGEIFRWRGEMHAKFASVRSPTAGKQRSGTALLRRGVCTMFGEAGKRPCWRLGVIRSAADFGGGAAG